MYSARIKHILEEIQGMYGINISVETTVITTLVQELEKENNQLNVKIAVVTDDVKRLLNKCKEN